jgi:hypothetical protein
MRRLLFATTLLLLALAAGVHAADRPRDLLIDACRDEKVDGTYSQRTYRRALDRLPADSDQYTACRDVINRARLAALSERRGNRGGSDGSGGGEGAGGRGGSGGGRPSGGGGDRDPLKDATPEERKAVQDATVAGNAPVRVGGELLRPGAVGRLASSGRDLPTPLIVLLAALGACALAAGAAAGWNRVLARRAG